MPVPTQLRAVIYARYSSDNQREASIDDQVRDCSARVATEGWQLVQVFRDAAISGATTLRPGYQALLAGAREAAFDIVVAEALDRLSRDQEDVAALFKRLQYAGVRLITLGEGEISALHIGLKGTMNSLFLKDLADKVRRGLRGRIENGKSGGGNSYGYTVVRRIDADGEPVRGDRIINQAEAAIIRRMFADYAAGVSPQKIALRLNGEGVAAPRGGAWSASTINGNRQRGTGILNNELYIGRLVWNRLRYVKDPDTGRRLSRTNAGGVVTTVEASELRIVSEAEWNAVKARQRSLDRPSRDESDLPATPAAFWSKQRPRYLFSGLLRCGRCGGGFSKISQAHFGCSTARNKGPTACTNLAVIRRDVLESTVLDKLKHRLMEPALFKQFAAEFTREWNAAQEAATGTQDALRNDLKRIEQQIERLVDALAAGTLPAAVTSRLTTLDQRRVQLEDKLSHIEAPAPRLHPNLAEVYRQKVAVLADVLSEDDGADAREMVRDLIDSIVLTPEGGTYRIDVRGELGAILALAGGGATVRTTRNSQIPGEGAEVLAEQMKMVAGTRSHLYRTRLQHA